jgi:glutathione S-transferase
MTIDFGEQARELAKRISDLSPETVDKPVLVYFNIIGICWPIRCLFHLKDIDYELIQIPIDVWAQPSPGGDLLLRSSFRNGHIPLYVDPQVCLNQSTVIMPYLAQKHDLLGDSEGEKYAILEVMAHAYDALFHWAGLLQVIAKPNIPDETVEARLQAFLGNGTWGLLSNGYHRNLQAFEQYLSANSDTRSGFIVGSRLSIADLHAYNVLCNWYKAFDRSLFTQRYPRLDDYVRQIAALPKVDEYIMDHQEPTTWLPVPSLGIRLTTPEELAGLND